MMPKSVFSEKIVLKQQAEAKMSASTEIISL
jgi:hypothetical protein